MNGQRPERNDRRGVVFILTLFGVGGLLTTAWIAFLIWFVFFHLF